MPAAGRGVPGTCGPLIGRWQPERLRPRRGGFLVPALCRRFAGSPGGRLALGRGLVAAGLRGGVPVLIGIPVTARAVRPCRGKAAVPARPLPLTVPAGPWPLTASRPGSVPVLVVVSAATRLVRPCRGITAVLAWPFPAGSRPLTASGFAANRTPPGKLAARRLMTAPPPVIPVTCGGLIPGGLAIAPWTPGWLAVARRAPASVTFGPGPVPSRRLTRGGGTGTARRVAGGRPGSGGGPHGTATADRVGRRVLAAATAGYGGALGRYRAWPPAGTRTGCCLLWPFGAVAVRATLTLATTARSCQVIGYPLRTRAGRGAP
jgi:hypothetical protein